MGISRSIAGSNLSNANMTGNWRIYEEFAYTLIDTAKKFYSEDKFCDEINQPIYALDSMTISMSLSLFPWAEFRKS